MHRLRCVVVSGALAVVVCVVAAGPAVAAKGGNSDNAHACQQGGHQNLFETETGNPFKNAGDCASHGGKGGTLTLLYIDPSTRNCDPVSTDICWGTLIGSNLPDNTPWQLNAVGAGVIQTGTASGTVNVNLMLACNIGFPAVWVTAQPPGGSIESEPPTASTCH